MKFSFVFAEDSSLLLKKVEELSSAFFQKNIAPAKRYVFWGEKGEEGLDSDFWQKLTFPSLIESADFFIIRRAENLNVDTWKNISEALGVLRENAFVVLCVEAEWKAKEKKIPAYVTNIKSQLCYTFAEKKSWNFYIPSLDARTIAFYIKDALKLRSLHCPQELFPRLLQIFPPNNAYAVAIDNTLDQLALVAENAELREEDFENFAPANPEVLFFDYIKYIENGTTFKLWENLLLEQNAETMLFPFLALLNREARILWQILCGEDVKLPSFVVNNKRAVAQKLRLTKVARIFMLTREADWAIKSGRKKAQQVMEELLADLGKLYS